MNPKKLLDSKWTAVDPSRKEKHFVVTRVVEPESPGTPAVSIEIEAVLTKRVTVMPWRELLDPAKWRQGWV